MQARQARQRYGSQKRVQGEFYSINVSNVIVRDAERSTEQKETTARKCALDVWPVVGRPLLHSSWFDATCRLPKQSRSRHALERTRGKKNAQLGLAHLIASNKNPSCHFLGAFRATNASRLLMQCDTGDQAWTSQVRYPSMTEPSLAVSLGRGQIV